MSTTPSQTPKPKTPKVNKTQQATNRVVEMLKLITSGPRFTRHLETILTESGLKTANAKKILKAAFQSL